MAEPTIAVSFSLETDVSGNGSYQGQLASSYTNWVATQVTGAADWIAYTWYSNQDPTPENLTIANQIASDLASGNFSLEDLFLAAQTKGTNTLEDITGTPAPVLDVAGVEIDLTMFFGDETDLASWSSGPAKNTQNHYREFFTTFESGTPPPNWGQEPPTNKAPTANPIVVDDLVETQSVYGNDLVIDNTNADLRAVDLLDPAHVSDPDGDTVSLVPDSVQLADGGALPSFITLVGSTLNIDQNSRHLDFLKSGEILEVEITYTVTDGDLTSTNTVSLTITGTADKFGDSAKTEEIKKTGTSDDLANFHGTIIIADLEELLLDSDNFDFEASLKVEALGDFDKTNESVTVTGEFDGNVRMSNNKSGQDNDNLINDALEDVVAVDASLVGDGFEYHVNFTEHVENGSYVTLELAYTYWA